ncbi:MAG: hypothetical protein NTX08_09660 [Sphingobacteriales bacterium]|nr:hypothetical protein [Sphingobacteriales bacterium]
MRNKTLILVGLFIILLGGSLSAQTKKDEVLNNNAILQLKKAGLDISTTPPTKLINNEIKSDSISASMTYNEKSCLDVGISASTFSTNDKNMFGIAINKKLFINFIFQLKISTKTEVKIVMRKLLFSDTKIQPEKLRMARVNGYNGGDLFVLDDIDNNNCCYFYVTYTNSGVEGIPNFPRKVGISKNYVRITSVNKDERTLSGELNIDAETSDGTPLKIKGTFSNISYDGGNISSPLYQR